MNIADWSADFPVIGGRKIHPINMEVPDRDDDQFDELRREMRTFGFDPEFPIRTFRDIVVNGKRRLRAALLENVTPIFREWPPKSNRMDEIEEEIKAFVIRQDIRRRHMSAEERTECVLRIRKYRSQPGRPAKPQENGAPKIASNEAITQAQVAREADTSRATVQRTVSAIKTVDNCCAAVKQAVKKQEFGSVDAAHLAGLPDTEQKKILQHARDNGCKLRVSLRELHARNQEIVGASSKTTSFRVRLEGSIIADAEPRAIDTAERIILDHLDRRGVDPSKYDPPVVTAIAREGQELKKVEKCVRCKCPIIEGTPCKRTDKGPVCKTVCVDGRTHAD